MAIDIASPRTRRALLTAALGAGVATVASAIGRPLPARAGVDGDVVLGGNNQPTNATRIENSTNDNDVVQLVSGSGLVLYASSGNRAIFAVGGSSNALLGQSTGDHAIIGQGFSSVTAGVAGQGVVNGTGLLGFSGSALPAAKAKTGVYGEAGQDTASRGVWGYSPTGQGIRGQATSGIGVRGLVTSGVGLSGEATTGYALRTSGRLKVDKASGVATILAGNTAVLVDPNLDVTSTSFVLLTPKADIGSRRLWYTTSTTANTITIRVSTAVTTGLQVGWLLLG